MRILEIIVNVFSRRRKPRFTDETPLQPETDFVAPPPASPLEAFERIPEVAALHSLISLAVNRLSWKVLSRSELYPDVYIENDVLTRRLDFNAGPLAADYLLLGECYVTSDLVRQHPRTASGGFRISKDPNSLSASPLASASWLIRKLWEYHRAQTQILALMGAGAFLHPKDAALPLTQDELENFRNLIKDKLRRGGAGGIEPISAAVEILPIPIDVEKYRLIEIHTELVRELCNLFAIDSSLMNDPENKTYSNKDLALRALYTNVVIPLAYELKHKLEITFTNLRIEIDHSHIEVLHSDREAQAKYVIQLLQSNIITREEARAMLEFE